MDGRGLNPRLRVLSCLVLLSLLPMAFPNPAAHAGSPGTGAGAGGETPTLSLAAQLEELARSNYGSYGIYLNVLETGEQAGYRQDETFYAASCYKLFLVMYIYESAARGELDLNRSIAVQGADLEGEEGVIQSSPPGTAFTTRELCRYAIVHSDNVAARMLKRAYGYHAFRDYAASIGCPVAGTYNINSTTAREMGLLLMRVLQFAAVDPLGREVLSFLKESALRDGIPAGLPEGIEVGNKTGDYRGYLNDAAVIFLDGMTCVLCVLSSGAPGFEVHAEASRLVYEDMLRRYQGQDALNNRPPSRQWLFAEASTPEDLETWLCLSNGNKSSAIAFLRPMGQEGTTAERRICVPPRSVMALRLNQLFGTGRDMALRIESDLPLLAERSTYCRHQGGWTLAGGSTGTTQATTDCYVRAARAGGGMETRLYLFNPGESEAHPTVVAMAAGARSSRIPVALPARGKASLPLDGFPDTAPSISACVFSDLPLLAEQMSFPR